MNGTKPPGRSRPTNNQLLYKAHFRWNHYTNELQEGTEMPSGTEACASVTSAFLQVLSTIHAVESARVHKPRNILHILSTNTRRTKVVELSTGTHRVADDLRRHSLSDGAGGHYSTNLDRNRYGSDNNYLFTVTRFDLEALGLCPCLVDIEIVDTRNGNESQIVSAGPEACSCDSPERKELADVSQFAGSYMAGGLPAGGARAPSPSREMRRVVSTGQLNGMRRVGSTPGLRRPPSGNRLHEYGGGRQAHSRGNSGSDLFDALLLAATGEADIRSHGEAAVNSRPLMGGGGGGRGAGGTAKAQQVAQQQQQQQQQQQGQPGGQGWQRYGSLNEADSLQNVVDAFKNEDAEGDRGGSARGKRPMLRRNSVSMILENPALAQTGAVDSLLMNYFPYGMAHAMHGVDGPEREGSMHSREGEGDTEGHHDHGDGAAGGGAGGEGEDPASLRQGLLRHFSKQSSAVNLTRLANMPAEVQRLREEIKAVREEKAALESELEESKAAKATAEAAEKTAEERMTSAQDACRRAGDMIQHLRQKLIEARTAAGQSGGDVDDELDPSSIEGLQTSDQEIEVLRAEMAEVKAKLAKVKGEKKELEQKLARRDSGALPKAGSMQSLQHSAFAAAMPYMGMMPMFGLSPLNPYGGIPTGGPGPAAAAGGGSGVKPPPGPGTMTKVKSMPSIHQTGSASPAPGAEKAGKRKADPPIPEDTEEEGGHGHGGEGSKRLAVGDGEKPVAGTIPTTATEGADTLGDEAVGEGLGVGIGGGSGGLTDERKDAALKAMFGSMNNVAALAALVSGAAGAGIGGQMKPGSPSKAGAAAAAAGGVGVGIQGAMNEAIVQQQIQQLAMNGGLSLPSGAGTGAGGAAALLQYQEQLAALLTAATAGMTGTSRPV